MQNEYDIEAVLNTRLSEFVEDYPIDVAFPAVPYEPKEGVPYIKVDNLPAGNVSVGIGEGTKNRYTGSYQLTVAIPANRGLADLRQIVNNLQTYFKRGTGLIMDDVKVRVTRFRLVTRMEESDWFTQFIRIEYRADLVN